MRSITNFLLIFAALVLAGCATKQPIIIDKPTITDTVFVYQTCATPPPREHLIFVPISWQVIDGRFSVDAEGYEKLTYNMIEILKGVEELKIEIAYYVKCLNRGV